MERNAHKDTPKNLIKSKQHRRAYQKRMGESWVSYSILNLDYALENLFRS